MEIHQPFGDNDTIYVPYTGATSNVDLGVFTLTAKSVIETTPTLLKLDQTTPQTIINGKPIFNVGLKANTLTEISLNSTSISHLTGTALAVVGADNATVRIGLSSFGIGGTNAFATRHARNTAANPQAVQDGDQLVSLEGWGYGATGYSITPKVMFRGYAAETWTDSAQGSKLSLWTTPNGSILPVERLHITNAGNVGIGTTSPTNILSLDGQSARTFWMERHTTSNTAGNNLTIQSGGATVSATDKNAGILTLSPGLSTGTGFSSIRLQSLSRASSTGTSDNTLTDAFIIPSEKPLTNTSVIPLFDISLATLQGTGGIIQYTIFSTNGTDMQTHTGLVTYAFVNKGGVYSGNIVDSDSPQGVDASGASAGAVTDAWTKTDGTNKITINVAATSSVITPTIMWIRYTITNNSRSSITQL